MPRERFEFPNGSGQRLAALLDSPPGMPRTYALFAHCFTCGKENLAASRIARALVAHGIAVLRFDFTGLGSSEGEFANTHFSSNVADLVAAADHLRRAHRAPALLIGHSLGGAAVLAAAGAVPEARAVATIGAPADPGHVTGLFRDRLDEIRARGEGEVSLAGRPFRIRREFLDDVAGQRLNERIARLGKALLILHAPLDEIVGIDNATGIFAAAKHPKSFVSLDDADHLLSHKADAAYAGDVIAAWARRYMESPESVPVAAATEEDLAPGTVIVSESGAGRLQQIVQAGRHRLVADEPERQGGRDSGPGPYDLLLAALGACTSMTLRLYAERKKLALERVAVRLAHGRIHAKDCAECETREGMLDHIERVVTLEGDLDAETRARLLEIAEKCPVHRTLTSRIHIRTRAAD